MEKYISLKIWFSMQVFTSTLIGDSVLSEILHRSFMWVRDKPSGILCEFKPFLGFISEISNTMTYNISWIAFLCFLGTY